MQKHVRAHAQIYFGQEIFEIHPICMTSKRDTITIFTHHFMYKVDKENHASKQLISRYFSKGQPSHLAQWVDCLTTNEPLRDKPCLRVSQPGPKPTNPGFTATDDSLKRGISG